MNRRNFFSKLLAPAAAAVVVAHGIEIKPENPGVFSAGTILCAHCRRILDCSPRETDVWKPGQRWFFARHGEIPRYAGNRLDLPFCPNEGKTFKVYSDQRIEEIRG